MRIMTNRTFGRYIAASFDQGFWLGCIASSVSIMLLSLWMVRRNGY